MNETSNTAKFPQYNVTTVKPQINTKAAATFYIKNTREGKLFRGTVNNAFLKTNLGSIPSKNEKIIIKNILPEKSKFEYPGPGTYDPKGNFTIMPEHKIKGFGHGFLSSSNRFEEEKLIKSSYSPGPGQYEIVKYKTNFRQTYIPNVIKLKVKEYQPGPGDYFKDNKTDWKYKKDKNNKEIYTSTFNGNFGGVFGSYGNDFTKTTNFNALGTSSFLSSSNREQNKNNKNLQTSPSPAEYFNDFYINQNKLNRMEKEISPMFRNPTEKKVYKEQVLHINDGDFQKYKYKITNRKGELYTNWKTQSIEENEEENHKNINKNLAKFLRDSEGSLDEQEENKGFGLRKNKKLNKIKNMHGKENGKIDNIKLELSSERYKNERSLSKTLNKPDLRYMKKIILEQKEKDKILKGESGSTKNGDGKLEPFSLAAPRWVDKHFSNGARFRVVGPAYYFPEVDYAKRKVK